MQHNKSVDSNIDLFEQAQNSLKRVGFGRKSPLNKVYYLSKCPEKEVLLKVKYVAVAKNLVAEISGTCGS